jgi:hypothetical protein
MVVDTNCRGAAIRSSGRCGARANRHGEGRSPAFLALDRDVPAMKTGQFLHEREADARAFVRAGSRVLDAVEALEDAGRSASGMPTPVSRRAAGHGRRATATRRESRRRT